MTGDAIGAWTAAAQFRMSALLNVLMGRTMACAATDWPGRVGVRPFRDVDMALSACKRVVRGLSQVGRLHKQRSGSSPSGLFLQVGVVMAGQALLGGGRRRRDGRNGIWNDRQTLPDKEKASGRLSAAYAPGYHARSGIATHVLKRDAR